MAKQRQWLLLAGLSVLPMLTAALGALVDERRDLGFTTWRSACRAAGLRLGSVIDFTFQLLPYTLTGLLLGGLGVLAIGILLRRTCGASCLAAHAGCALTLPLGALICAVSVPLPLMLLADAGIAALAAWLLLRAISGAAGVHP